MLMIRSLHNKIIKNYLLLICCIIFAFPSIIFADDINSRSTVERIRRIEVDLKFASFDVRSMARWIIWSSDNGNKPFAIVDKIEAKIYVFFSDGRLSGVAPILLGLTIGDYSVPGVGERPLSSIGVNERTTPAGRFVSGMDYNIKGKEILWVDYDLAISIHPVVKGKPKDRRLERLMSPQSSDNRISFGCINVPVNFFEEVVKQTFAGTDGIIYVLPETKVIKEVFKAYVDVEENYWNSN